MNTFYLGVVTILGDSDSVQTYIQLIGIIIAFLSAIAVVVTLNLQRISFNEQTKINDLDLKIKLEQLSPDISVNIRSVPSANDEYNINLIIENADAIIYSFGFKENKNYILKDDNILKPANLIIKKGTHLLKTIKLNPNQFAKNAGQSVMNKVQNFNDDLILELFYSDKYYIQKYKYEFIIRGIISSPTIESYSFIKIS